MKLDESNNKVVTDNKKELGKHKRESRCNVKFLECSTSCRMINMVDIILECAL